MMNKEIEDLWKLTCKTVRNTEVLLHQPLIQARNPLAEEVRTLLIRGLFYGDRSVTALLDGIDYRFYFSNMTANLDTADRKLADLQRTVA